MTAFAVLCTLKFRAVKNLAEIAKRITDPRFEALKIISFRVPKDYDVFLEPEKFVTERRIWFDFVHDVLVEGRFPEPSDTLKAGARYKAVLIYAKDPVGYDPCLDLLKGLGSLFVGAKGVPVLYDALHTSLRNNQWAAFFDVRERLYAVRDHRMLPCLQFPEKRKTVLNLAPTSHMFGRETLLVSVHKA